MRRIRKQSGGLFSRRTRKHGGAKRCIWRKIHLGIGEQTLEVRAVEVTTNDIGDAPMLPELLGEIAAHHEVASVTADGAYDVNRRRILPACWSAPLRVDTITRRF